MRIIATGLVPLFVLSPALGQVTHTAPPTPMQVVLRPCLMVTPQILLFTVENRYHQIILFNTCNTPLRWWAGTPFPFIRIDTSQAANPIPPGKMTPVGIYINWDMVPNYAISIREPAPILDWLEKVLGREIPREAKLYFAFGTVSFCETNAPARACVPVLIFLLRAEK